LINKIAAPSFLTDLQFAKLNSRISFDLNVKHIYTPITTEVLRRDVSTWNIFIHLSQQKCWGEMCCPRITPTFFYGCDRCINMFHIETFQLPGKRFSRIINWSALIDKQNCGAQLSHRFTICEIKLDTRKPFSWKLKCFDVKHIYTPITTEVLRRDVSTWNIFIHLSQQKCWREMCRREPYLYNLRN
jgi:hypothetical protein